MHLIDFPEANVTFGPPPDMEASQVQPARAYVGKIDRGSCEGASVTVCAWQPTDEERAAIAAGEPVFISMLIAGLVPHMLTTNFHNATHPA